MNIFLNNLKIQLSNIDVSKLETFKKLVLDSKGTILILGNGGSNAIASHIAEDYTKALKKPAISFSDAARLTCYSNDYGYENAFKQFLKEFSDKHSLIILISSSGNSANIIKCAEYCKDNNIKFVIFSGFNKENKLQTFSKEAELNFWIDSTNYGVVECIHEIILHSII